jgi:hypothetical protein
MAYEKQIGAMRVLAATFDSIDYVGVGRQGLARCIAAFEIGDKEKALAEYRKTIGEAGNFAEALTDLDTKLLTKDGDFSYFNQVLAVMVIMALLMNGNVK